MNEAKGAVSYGAIWSTEHTSEFHTRYVTLLTCTDKRWIPCYFEVQDDYYRAQFHLISEYLLRMDYRFTGRYASLSRMIWLETQWRIRESSTIKDR